MKTVQGWAQRELDRTVKEHVGMPFGNLRQIRLRNRDEEKELDEKLLVGAWPEMEKALTDRTLEWWTGTGASIAQDITSVEDIYTRRDLTARITDPTRPQVEAGEPATPWEPSLSVGVTSHSFIVAPSITLEFIEGQEQAALELLSDPRMQGCPPEMGWRVGYDSARGDTWEVRLGENAREISMPIHPLVEGVEGMAKQRTLDPTLEWALRWNGQTEERMRRKIAHDANALIEIIERMDALAERWRDAERKEALQEAVVRLYRCE